VAKYKKLKCMHLFQQIIMLFSLDCHFSFKTPLKSLGQMIVVFKIIYTEYIPDFYV